MRKLFLQTTVICFFLAGSSSMSFAGYGSMKSGGGGGGGSSAPARPAPPPPPPPIDRSASIKARQDIAAATTDSAQADAALASITSQIRKQRLEPTSEWKTANDALTIAKTHYETAKEAAMTKLKSDPGYQAVLAERTKAKTDHAAMEASTPIEERMRIAKAILTTADQVAALEAGALANNEAVVKAKAELDAATAKMNQLFATFDATLSSNPQWAAASKTADERHQRLATAKQSLVDAQTREAQAEKDRQKQMASNH
jgi:hypothetical protein